MKKYKTAAGYLRAQGDRICADIYRIKSQDREQILAAAQAGQRTALNSLLPQLGLPCIEATEKPADGIERLMQMGSTEQQQAALKTCRRWLRNFFIPISSSVVVRSGPADWRVSYHVCGFRRDDHKVRVNMIVDVDEAERGAVSPHAIAEKIAGPEYCFHACSNIDHSVPESAKNQLFMSDEELYAADPQLKPRYLRRAAR